MVDITHGVKMSKLILSVCLSVLLISVTEGVFWGSLGNNFGAFQRWKHRVVFGSGGNRREGGGGGGGQNSVVTNPGTSVGGGNRLVTLEI